MATDGNPECLESAARNPLTDDFKQFAQSVLDEWHVPGISIAVIDGHTVFSEGYGWATIDEEPSLPQTVWYTGSTTKAFTAATLSQLINSGKYPALSRGWQTPIASIIPEDFVLQDEWMTKNLTLEDAAVHRTGVSRHENATSREREGQPTVAKDVVRNMRNLQITGDARVKFTYTNMMYVALGHVLETLTGEELEEVFKKEIWDPLEMNSTHLKAEAALQGSNHVATGYYWDEKSKDFKSVPKLPTAQLSGAGAVMSNVVDYAKWIKCLLKEADPFSKAVHTDIRTPRIMGAMPSGALDINMYGLGWQRNIYKGHPFYNHNGGLDAYGGEVYWFPDVDFGVVAFGNTAMTSNIACSILIWRLVNEKLGIRVSEGHDPSMQWRGILAMLSGGDRSGAMKRIFPACTGLPTPSSWTTAQLEGTYHDPGYKDIVLREETHPDKPEEKVLVAERPDMEFRKRLTFYHVSGDDWLVHVEWMDVDVPFFKDYLKASFKGTPDGKPSALDIEWTSMMGMIREGTVSFKKTG